MGSGASNRSKAQEAYRASKLEHDSLDEGTKKVKKQSKRAKFSEHQDVLWHQRNCLHQHFFQCATIAEAYPFDDNAMKTVKKKEEKWEPLDGRNRNWGSVKVHKNMPSKLSCDVCGVFLVDKNSSSQFFCCSNCKLHDRKFEVCVQCYHSRAAEKSTSQIERLAERRQSGSKSSSGSRSSSKRRDSVSSKHSTCSRSSSTFASEDEGMSFQAPLKKKMMTGWYQATLTELNFERHELYQLTFVGDNVTGKGPDDSQVRGTLNGKALEWNEKRKWGECHVRVVQRECGKYTGTFEASDGGKGAIVLTVA